MANIPSSQARPVFTQARIAEYRERARSTSFLRSFFNTDETGDKYLSIEVQRGTEKVAVDVQRGTEGNRNSISKSTEKIFLPPYYHEFLDATELSLYDRLFSASGVISGTDLAAFTRELNDGLSMLQDKIERAYELQCSQVLETGIVSLQYGTNIDFKRKAASMVDLGAGAYWSVATVDPRVALGAGANFLRQVGKAQGGTFNLVMGSDALNSLLNNAVFKASADLRRITLEEVRNPQRNSVGGSLHGQVSAGAYNFNIWTYPEFYDAAGGASTPYINAKKVIMLPEAPMFKLGFAAVPQILTDGGAQTTKGAYIFNDYVDQKKGAHEFDIKSAGVAIPVAVDQIYTFQAIA